MDDDLIEKAEELAREVQYDAKSYSKTEKLATAVLALTEEIRYLRGDKPRPSAEPEPEPDPTPAPPPPCEECGHTLRQPWQTRHVHCSKTTAHWRERVTQLGR